MINLLPDDVKKQISAARTNIMLVKYIIVLGFAIAFLALACTMTYLLLINNKTIAEKIIENSQFKNTPYSLAKKQESSLRTSLSTAKSILDQQILYSNVITGIGAALPTGIVLDTLSLNSSTFGTPITIKAYARSADDVTKLKENFQNSTLFSNFSVTSLTTNQSDSSGYPVTISISTIINKGAAQ